MTHPLRTFHLLAAAAMGAAFAGCGGSGGGGAAATPPTPPAPPAGVTPSIAPSGTSGTNLSVTLAGGTEVTGAAVVGETVPAQAGSAILPGGTTVEVRHGFFPGDQPPTPAGPG